MEINPNYNSSSLVALQDREKDMKDTMEKLSKWMRLMLEMIVANQIPHDGHIISFGSDGSVSEISDTAALKQD